MSKQIFISAASVSPALTRDASAAIMRHFGGYTRADAFGGYTFKDGRTAEQPSVLWIIGTAASTAEQCAALWNWVSGFAADYCAAGEQESIYFADADGETYIAFADGRILPID